MTAAKPSQTPTSSKWPIYLHISPNNTQTLFKSRQAALEYYDKLGGQVLVSYGHGFIEIRPLPKF